MLDLKTVFILWICQATTVGVLFLSAWLFRPAMRFYLFWALGFLCHGCGVMLMVSAAALPPLISFWSASLIALSAYFFWVNGLRQSDRRTVAVTAFAPAALWLAVMLSPFAPEVLSIRIGLYGLCATLGYGMMAFNTARLGFSSRGSRYGLAAVWLALAANSLTYGVLGFIGTPHDVMRLAIAPIYVIFAMTCFLASLLIGAKIVMDRSETKLRELVAHDPLTGALNRRGLSERLAALHRRGGEAIAVLLFDIDHFKRVNDTYGHEAGDNVLIAFARSCRAALPPEALLARSGGEEFCAVVPLAPGAEPLTFGRAAIEAVAGTVIHTERAAISVTASLGIAIEDGKGFDFDRLMSRADKALYRAKAEGRNRAVCEDGRIALGPETGREAGTGEPVNPVRQISAA